MPIIDIRNHAGDVTGRLYQFAEALVAACVAAKLPGVNEGSVAVTDGGRALVKDNRFLVIRVLLVAKGSSLVPNHTHILASVLAKAAGALLDPDWNVLVVVEWDWIDMKGATAREQGSRVMPEASVQVVELEGEAVAVPSPPNSHPDYTVGFEWLSSNASLLQQRYRGQWVAVHRDVVIVAGNEEGVRSHVRRYGLEAVAVVWLVKDGVAV